MAFGRKVDDPVDIILTEQRPQHIQVADVTLLEHVVRGILDVPQVGKVPRVGQFVQVHDPVIRVFRHEQAYYVPIKPAPPVIRIVRFMGYFL